MYYKKNIFYQINTKREYYLIKFPTKIYL